MELGERVNLIQSIYATLSGSALPWNVIEMVLDEFGADASVRASGEDRVLQRTRSLPDDKLIALHAHLHPDEGPSASLPTSDDGGPWRPDHFRLFISHTSANKVAAGKIRTWMERYGVDGFVAHTTIEPTSEWIDVIQTALRSCHAMVALLTEDFRTSRWCDQEVGFCVGRGILIVPVRIGVDPYGFIGRYQGLTPANRQLSDLASQLFDLLAVNPLTKSRMVDPVVRRFAGSRSYDGTRAAWPLVKTLPRDAWTDERIRTVRDAVESNSQLSGAFVQEQGQDRWTPVPDGVETHFRSLGIPTDADDIPS
jgi:hypothetical protein